MLYHLYFLKLMSNCAFFILGKIYTAKFVKKVLNQSRTASASFHFLFDRLLHCHFVPVNDVIETFNILKESGLISEKADEILDYFEDNYKGRIDARSKHESGRRNPRFSVKSWNMYDSVLACSPRTNNAVEGWHTAFAKFVGVTHPSLFVLFEKFQIEQSNSCT